MRKKKTKIIFRRNTVKRIVSENGDLDMLKSSWNNMPDDYTAEERMLFLDFVEKTIGAYKIWKQLNSEEERNNKN